jgi:hypothetical protein
MAMESTTAIHGLTFHNSRFGRTVAKRHDQLRRASAVDRRVALPLGKRPA